MASTREITPEDRKALETHYPSKRKGPKDSGDSGTFEIAIMLAGAVSAGAYTAGVMDFLIEALDEWHRLKTADDKAGYKRTDRQTVPHHKVVLRIITGTSAGGMNGAIAAAALYDDFPHIYDQKKYAELAAQPGANLPPQQRYDENPFYQAWVDRIDIEPMLATHDIGDRMPLSLFNTGVLRSIADGILSFKGQPVPTGMRDWLANPFEVRLTNTNLRGVPFAFNLRAEEPKAHQGFLMHADQLAFAIKKASTLADEGARPDCIVLDNDLPRSAKAWQSLGIAGLATGAFPIALSARDITPDPSHYLWRNSFYDVDVPPDDEKAHDERAYIFVNPNWPDNKTPQSHPYAAVDGGVMNNEPFEIARRALAGPRGQNPQGGKEADRAVIVIDPFIEDPKEGPAGNATMLKVAGQMLPALMSQARLSAQDLVQVQREDVYSRFMISPSRDGPTRDQVFGKGALATGELGAFIGFFCRDYRHHDYLLGRRNAQKFLRDVFTLPATNELFHGRRWTHQNKKDYADPTTSDAHLHLQIIPLCGHLKDNPESVPDWPRGAYKLRRDRIALLIKERIGALSGILRRELAIAFVPYPRPGMPGIIRRVKSTGCRALVAVLLKFGWCYVRGKIFDAAVNAIDHSVARIDKDFL